MKSLPKLSFNLGHLALLITAIIFGFGFLFQSHAAKQANLNEVSVFTLWFVFCRSAVAVLFVLFLLYFYYPKKTNLNKNISNKGWFFYGGISGILFSFGMFLQQSGLAYTSVSKSGFITSLYVVLVPIIACLFFHANKPAKEVWWAALIMLLGLFCFAGIRSDDISSWNWGDSLTLCSALCFAIQVVFFGLIVQKFMVAQLLLGQFMAVCLVCLLLVLLQGKLEIFTNLHWYKKCYIDILVTGLGSSGIAFLLQGYGQKIVPTAHAALILAFEAVFAAIFAWFVYDERMNFLMFLGASLMLVAILVAQLGTIRKIHK